MMRSRRDRELKTELQSHLEMAVRDHMDRGLSRVEAEAAARREFGNFGLVQEVTRAMWGWSSLERLAQDLRYGLRMLAKSPGFTLVAVLTLALGIGANSALFSIVNGVLLAPLPFPHSQRLVALYESKPNFPEGSFSYPNYLDLKHDNQTFESMAVYRQSRFTLTGAGDAERMPGNMVSAEFFPLLGVQPVLGRVFTPEEDDLGKPPVAIIGEGVWKRKFGASPSVIGKSVMLSGVARTIVGIVPASFRLAIWNFREADIYIPIGQWDNPRFRDRSMTPGMNGIGRLKPGVTLEQARGDLNRITSNLAVAYPESCRGIGVTLKTLRQAMVGDIEPFLLLLLAAVAFVLLIACVNVANLLLARANARNREFALRAALGASHFRVLRQLLTESVLLASLGGAAGLLLASWGTAAAIRLVPDTLPRVEEIHLDGRVLLFTSLVSMLAGILFGLIPALRISRTDLNSPLQDGSRGSVAGRQRAHAVFVVMELALALVLLVGSGLMIRTLARLWSLDLGFDPHDVVSTAVALPSAGKPASDSSREALMREMHARIAAIPGVEAASVTWGATPMWGDDEANFWLDTEPRPATDNEMKWALDYIVEPDYFRVMRIQLLRGRLLRDADDARAPRVALVDQTFAEIFFPNQDPVGRHINTKEYGEGIEIVGVVRHINQWGLGADPAKFTLHAQLYFPILQLPAAQASQLPNGTGLMVRTALPPAVVTENIRRALTPINSQAVVYNTMPMDFIVGRTLAARRFAMLLLAIFAGLALVLASIGIYGVISYGVGRRSREIGIRMALGAQHRDVLRLLLAEGFRLTLLGIAVGIVAALSLSHLLEKMLFGIRPTDPLTFSAVVALLMSVALLACYLPARRALRVNPTVALRAE